MKERLVTILFAVLRKHNLGIDNESLRIIESDIEIFLNTYSPGEKRQQGITDFETFVERMTDYALEEQENLISKKAIENARKKCGLIFWCKIERNERDR